MVLAAALLTTTVLIVRCEGDNVNGPKLLSRTQASLRVRPADDIEGDPNRFASYKQLPHIFIQKPTDQQIPLAHMQLPCPASGGSSSGASGGGAQASSASGSGAFNMNLCVFDDQDETFLDGFLTGRGVDIALSGAGSFPPIYFADAEHDDYGGSLVYSEVVLGQGGETLQGFSPERKGEWMSDFGYLPARKPGNAAANQCLYYEAGSGGEGVEKPSPFPHQCPSSIGLRYAHSHVFNAAAFFDDLPNGQNIQNMRLTAYSENALVFSVLLDAHRRITLIPRHIGVGQLVLKATPIGVGGLPHLRKIQVGVVPFQQARARVHPRDTAVSPTPEAGSHLAWEALLHGPEKMLRGNIAEYRMLMHEGHPKSTTGDNSTFITQLQSLFCPSIPKAESGCTSSLSGDSCTQAGGQTTSGGEGQTCQCPQASGPTCTGHLAGFLPVYTFWNDGDSRGDSDRAWHYRRNSSAARNYGGVVANLIEGYIGVYGQPRRAVGAQSSEALSSKFVVLDSRAPRSQRANSGPQVVSYTQSSQSQGRFTCPDRAVCWASQNDLRHEGCDSDFCVFTTPGPKEILQGAATGGAATGGVATGGTATSAAGGTTEESLPVIRQASHSLAYSLPRGIPTHHTMNIFIPSRDEAEDTPAPNNNGDPFMTLYVGFEPQGYSPASVQANSIKPGVSTAERPFVPVKIYEQWRDLFSDTACTFEEGRVPEGSDGQCVPHRPGSRTPRDPDCCTPPVDIAFARMEATAADGDTDPTLKNADFSGAMSGAWKCKEARAMGGISGGVGRGASGAGGAGGGGANANAPRYECTELEVAERGAAGAAVWCLPKAVAINASGGVSAAPSELRLPMYAMYGHQGLAVSFKQPGACPQACRGDGASGGPGGPCLQMSGSQALESIRHFADSFTLRVTDAFYNVKDLKIKLKTLAGPDGRDPDDGPTRESRRVLVSLAPVAGVTTRTPAPIMDVPENITQPLKLTLSSPFAEDVRVRFSVNNGGGANAARKCDGSASREGGLQFGDLCTVVGVFSELAEALDCDFEAQAGHLTIPARQTEVELPLCILSDSRVEANENFSVTLSDLRADCGSGRPGCVAFQGRDTQSKPTTITRTINIVNDDQAAASLEIAGIVRASESCNALCSAAAVSGRSSFVPGASICRSYSGSVSEGDKICFKASLSSSFGERKQVAWHALRKAGQAQHATPGTDFTCSRVSTPDNQGCAMRSTPVPARLTGALTFEAGAREQMFGVAIALDKLSDADESFEVCLGEQTSTSCAVATPQGSSRVRALSFSEHRHTVKIKNVIKMYIAQDCGAPINVLRPIRLSETTHLHRLKLCISNSSLQVTRPFDVRLMSLPFLGSAELSSATPGVDFKPINQSYRFTANNRSGGLGFEINIMDDRISEGPEAFLLRLLPSDGSVSGLASVVGLLSEGLRRRAGWPEGLDVVEETRVVITDNEPPVVRMALLQPLPSGACPQANSPAAMQSVEANTMIEGQNLCVKVFTTQRLLDGDTLRLRLGAYGDDRSDGSNFTADDCNRLGADEICDFSLQAASAVAASGGSGGAIRATSAADITLSADGRCLGGFEPTRSGCESGGGLWVPLPSAQVLRLTTHYDNDDAEANEKLKLFLCPAGDGVCSPGAADVAVTRATGADSGTGSGSLSGFKIDSNWNQRTVAIIDGARVGEGVRVNIAGGSTVQEGSDLTLTLSLQRGDNTHFRSSVGVCWRAMDVDDRTTGIDPRTLADEGVDFYGMTNNNEGRPQCGEVVRRDDERSPPCWQPLLSQNGFSTWSNGDYSTSYPIRVHAYADGRPEKSEKFQIQFRLAQIVGDNIDCSRTDAQSRVGFQDTGLSGGQQLLSTSRDYLKTITIEDSNAGPDLTLFAYHDDNENGYDWPILLNDSRITGAARRLSLFSLGSRQCRAAADPEPSTSQLGYSITYDGSVRASSRVDARDQCGRGLRLAASRLAVAEGAYACLRVERVARSSGASGGNNDNRVSVSHLDLKTVAREADETDFEVRNYRFAAPQTFGIPEYRVIKILNDPEPEICESFEVELSAGTAKVRERINIVEDHNAWRNKGLNSDTVMQWRFAAASPTFINPSSVFANPQMTWASAPPANICPTPLNASRDWRTAWCGGLVGYRGLRAQKKSTATVDGCDAKVQVEARLSPDSSNLASLDAEKKATCGEGINSFDCFRFPVRVFNSEFHKWTCTAEPVISIAGVREVDTLAACSGASAPNTLAGATARGARIQEGDNGDTKFACVTVQVSPALPRGGTVTVNWATEPTEPAAPQGGGRTPVATTVPAVPCTAANSPYLCDYGPSASGALSFTAASSKRHVAIPISSDILVESDESFVFKISSSNLPGFNADNEAYRRTIIIEDNDEAEISIVAVASAPSIDDDNTNQPCSTGSATDNMEANVPEGQYACVKVKLNKLITEPIKVGWSVNGLSASAGDYDLAAARPIGPQELKWECVPTLGVTASGGGRSPCVQAGGTRSTSGTCDCSGNDALYRTIALRIVDDGADEMECVEDLSIALGAVKGAGASLVQVSEQRSARVTIPGAATALARISLECGDPTDPDGDGPLPNSVAVSVGDSLSCTVRLKKVSEENEESEGSKALPYPVTANWQAVDGTAIANLDYTATGTASNQVTIPNGRTEANFSVSTMSSARHHKWFKIQLLKAGIRRTADNSGSNQCIDKDTSAEVKALIVTPPPKVQVAGNLSVKEDEGLAQLAIKLSRTYIDPIVLKYKTASIDEQELGDNVDAASNVAQGNGIGPDYIEQATWKNLKIAAGDQEGEISIVIPNDSLIEPDEAFQVQVQLPDNAPAGVQFEEEAGGSSESTDNRSIQRTVTITDDDSARLTLALVGHVDNERNCKGSTEPTALTKVDGSLDGETADGTISEEELDNFEVPEGKSACFKVALSKQVPQEIMARWSVRDGTATNEDYDIPEDSAERTVSFAALQQAAYFAIDIPPSSDNNNECDESFEVVLSNQVGDLGATWPSNLQFNAATDGKARVNIKGQDNLIQVSLDCAPWIASTGRWLKECTAGGDRYAEGTNEIDCATGRGQWESSRAGDDKCRCNISVVSQPGKLFLSFPNNRNRCEVTSEFKNGGGPGFDQDINVEWEYREGTATRGDYAAQSGRGTIARGSGEGVGIPIALTPGATDGEYFFVELTRAWRSGDKPSENSCIEVNKSRWTNAQLQRINNQWQGTGCPSLTMGASSNKQPLCIAPNHPAGGGVQAPEVSIDLAGYTADAARCETGKCSVSGRSDVGACEDAGGRWGPDFSGGGSELLSTATDEQRAAFVVPEGRYACFKASLSKRVASGVTVAYDIVRGTARGDDYTDPQNKTIAFSSTQTARYVAVQTLASDATEICYDDFSLKLKELASSPLPSGVKIAAAEHSIARVVIKDQPRATLALEHISEPPQPHAGGQARFKISLNDNKQLERVIQIPWQARNGLGPKGATNIDYPAYSGGAVSFAVGQTSQEFPISIRPTARAGKWFYARLDRDNISDATKACVEVPALVAVDVRQGDSCTTSLPHAKCETNVVTIKKTPIIATLASRDVRVAECEEGEACNNGDTRVAQVSVTLSAVPQERVKLNYKTALVSESELSENMERAVAGADYTAIAATPLRQLTWAARDTDLTKSVTVNILNDDRLESDEAFDVVLEVAEGTVKFNTENSDKSTDKARIVIEDDDAARMTLALVGYTDTGATCEVATGDHPTFTNPAKCSDGGAVPAQCTGDKVWYQAGSGVDADKSGTISDAEREAFVVPEGKYACFKASLNKELDQTIKARWDVADGTATDEDYDLPDVATTRLLTFASNVRQQYFSLRISGGNSNECQEHFDVRLTKQLNDLDEIWPSGLVLASDESRARVQIKGEKGLIKVRLACNPWQVARGSVREQCFGTGGYTSLVNRSQCLAGNGHWDADRLGGTCKCLGKKTGDVFYTVHDNTMLDDRYLVYPSSQSCTVVMDMKTGTNAYASGRGFDQPVVVDWEFREGTATRGDFTAQRGTGTIAVGQSAVSIPIVLTPGAVPGEYFYVDLIRAYRANDVPSDDSDSACVTLDKTSLTSPPVPQFTTAWAATNCSGSSPGQITAVATSATNHKQPLCIAPPPPLIPRPILA